MLMMMNKKHDGNYLNHHFNGTARIAHIICLEKEVFFVHMILFATFFGKTRTEVLSVISQLIAKALQVPP